MSPADQAIEHENRLNSQVEERQGTPNCKPNLFVHDVPVTEFLKVIDYLDQPRYPIHRRRHSSLPQNFPRSNSHDLDLNSDGQRSRHMSTGNVSVKKSVICRDVKALQGPGKTAQSAAMQDVEQNQLTEFGSMNDLPPPPPELLVSLSDIQTPPQPVTIVGMGGPTPKDPSVSIGTGAPPARGVSSPLTPPASSNESVFIATHQSPHAIPWGKDTPTRHMLY